MEMIFVDWMEIET